MPQGTINLCQNADQKNEITVGLAKPLLKKFTTNQLILFIKQITTVKIIPTFFSTFTQNKGIERVGARCQDSTASMPRYMLFKS